MLDVDAIAADIPFFEFAHKRGGTGQDPIGGGKRPPVHLIVNSHFCVGIGVAVMKCNPSSRTLKACAPHQEMGLYAVGPDQVGAPLFEQGTQLRNHSCVEPAAFNHDVQRSAGIPDRLCKAVFTFSTIERCNRQIDLRKA